MVCFAAMVGSDAVGAVESSVLTLSTRLIGSARKFKAGERCATLSRLTVNSPINCGLVISLRLSVATPLSLMDKVTLNDWFNGTVLGIVSAVLIVWPLLVTSLTCWPGSFRAMPILSGWYFSMKASCLSLFAGSDVAFANWTDNSLLNGS